MEALITAAALAVAALVYGLERFGMLPKRKSATDAAAEIQILLEKNARLERDLATEKAQKLELVETALKPVAAQLLENSRLQSQILDRLALHNGSFRHQEQAMREVHVALQALADGVRVVTGFITSDFATERAEREEHALTQKETRTP